MFVKCIKEDSYGKKIFVTDLNKEENFHKYLADHYQFQRAPAGSPYFSRNPEESLFFSSYCKQASVGVLYECDIKYTKKVLPTGRTFINIYVNNLRAC